MRAAGAQKKEQELPDQWGSFFCLIEVGILSPSLGLLCTTRVQLQWLRPLVAPVSSSAPGRGDCPALIPTLIIFKAAGIYITLMQAPVALQLPQEAAFLAFLSCLVGRDCYHGRERRLGTTEVSAQLVGFGCFPDSDCFSTCTNGLNICSSAKLFSNRNNFSFLEKRVFTRYTLTSPWEALHWNICGITCSTNCSRDWPQSQTGLLVTFINWFYYADWYNQFKSTASIKLSRKVHFRPWKP